MPVSRTPIILVLLGLLVIGAALYLLFGAKSGQTALSEGTPASAAELSFLTLTAQIEPVAFNTTIFSDPRFLALQDIRTAIIPEAAGRIDPFAPLGR